MIWTRKNKYPFTNIYHCSVHKGGSQWIMALLSDSEIKKITGMDMYSYQSHMADGFDPRKLTERFFTKPFPEKKIVSVMYLSYACYESIPKPSAHRGVYVQRDPRDLLISYYFSMKDSHVSMGGIDAGRNILQNKELKEGLKYVMAHMEERGVWASMISWYEQNDPNVIVLNYEDLISEDRKFFFNKMFDHLQLDLKPSLRNHLIEKYSFNSMSGRKPGEENQSQHMRKGIKADWKNYLDEDLIEAFKKTNEQVWYAFCAQ